MTTDHFVCKYYKGICADLGTCRFKKKKSKIIYFTFETYFAVRIEKIVGYRLKIELQRCKLWADNF